MHISPVTTQLGQSICFFATLIENLPALTENLQRFSIQNKKEPSVCFCIYMDTSWRIWSMDAKETFSRDAAHTIDLNLNILNPVPGISTLKLMKFT